MKRQTITLSLITMALLGLNGCGETSKATEVSEANIKLSSIQKFSNASKKHEASDWISIENTIQNLDNPEQFNTMLLGSFDKNIATLNYVGIDKEEASATTSDAMYDDLIALDIADLDKQIVVECKEDESCINEAISSLELSVLLEKEEAYSMSEEIRGEAKGLVNDKLVKSFTCEANEVRTVQHYGIEDLFNTANGAEVANPSATILGTPWIMNYPFPVTAYDEVNNNRIFADTIRNLPSDITKGMFYIGFKSNGSSLQANDTFKLGSYASANKFNTRLDNFDATWTNQQVSNTNPTTDIYYNKFSNINLATGNLLDLANSNHEFDVVVEDDTAVDFITVATCSKPDPIKEVSQIVNKFECSEKETLVKILGGEIDAFSAIADANPTNPSADLITKRDTNTAYPGVDVSYDYHAYDYHFIDTLSLGLTAGQTVTQAQFNIGYKVIGSSLASNDAMYIGNFGVNHAGGHLYSTTTPIIPQGWNVANISNYGHVANIDLSNLNNNLGIGNVFNTMLNNAELDIYVQDDTAVDFTQLNLCVRDK
ncbi:MAG: Chitinase [uncultured Sulfurovum sp.]|uniref:Chitinase n=1 Tax=uncultured Sulfurovum sp. TaxID=269237 RepID=A0A6S6T633_9BACT|nr:MAG: Chitinase [uncultured Sulfurovum sp.]